MHTAKKPAERGRGGLPKSDLLGGDQWDNNPHHPKLQPKADDCAGAYPFTPGFKGDADTGRDGARKFAPKCATRQAEALEALRALGEASAEQIAERTGRHWYLTRPRLSELKAQGMVQDTGRRAPTTMGGNTIVWRCSTPEELAIHLAREAVETEKFGGAA
jgi:hypothetical protein